MPNIREVTNKADLTARPEGSTAFAYLAGAQQQSGRSIGNSVGGAIEDVGHVALDFAKHQDLSRKAAEYATFVAEKKKEWDEISAAPGSEGNPNLLSDFFKNNIDPSLTKFANEGTITGEGRDWAVASALDLRSHLVASTAADMSALSGLRIKKEAEQTMNALSVAAALRPWDLPSLIPQMKMLVPNHTASPYLTPQQRVALTSELEDQGVTLLIKSAVASEIMKDPDSGLALMKKPEYAKYLTGLDIKQAEASAETVRRANRADAEAADRKIDRDTIKASDERRHAYEKTMFDDKGELIIDPKFNSKVLADQTLTSAAKQTLINLHRQMLEAPPAADAPGLVGKMLTASIDNNLTAEEVYQATAKGELTWTSADHLLSAIRRENPEEAQNRPLFMASLKAAVNDVNPKDPGPLGGISKSLEAQVQEDLMTAAAYRRYRDGIDKKIPVRDLLDPTSKDYIFSQYFLKPYIAGAREGSAGGAGSLNLGGPAIPSTAPTKKATPPPAGPMSVAPKPGVSKKPTAAQFMGFE